MHRVFLADQDPRGVELIAAGFTELGYSVEVVHDVAVAVAAARSSGANVALIARTRPMICGPDVVRHFETAAPRLPMLLITDKQAGEAGSGQRAEGGSCKPFALAQIAARLRAQLDREAVHPAHEIPVREPHTSSTLRVADLEIERNSRRVFRAGIAIDVTRREYVLLEHLALHSETTVTRATIAREVWHAEHRATTLDNVIDVHIGRLRRKLAVAGRSPLIHTVRGMGYTLRADQALDGGTAKD